MQFRLKGSRSRAGNEASPASTQGPVCLFLMTLWFGLVAGWLDLGLTLGQRTFYPHVTADSLRTNRHFLWMVPVSDALMFIIAGCLIALVAIFRPRLARWVAFRLPVAIFFLTLLLNIEGLHALACVTLACGLGSQVGPWLERRGLGIARLVRVTFPAIALGFMLMAGLSYERVISAERRALAARPPAKADASNVLLVVLDTVRAECLSLYGHLRETTPNLDRLAARGLVFTQARATAPWTTPTHASMMTGRWPHELSVRPGVPLDGTFPTLAEVLKKEGYATAGFVGNVYYCNAAYGLDRGFARYEDAYENQTVSLLETLQSSALGRQVNRLFGYPKPPDPVETLVRKSAAMINRDVLGWFDSRPADRPFFVFINYYDAHRPYIFHDDPAPRFGLAALPIDEHVKVDTAFLNLTARKPDPLELTPEFIAEATRITKDAFTLYHDSYDSCIAYLDRQVGLLVEEMERRGVLENTLVIITSDHGEQIGEHGMISHGTSVYRPEVHVPLVVIPPSSMACSGVIGEPVSVREIPATVAELAALGQPNPFPGRSLTRFINDDVSSGAETSPVVCELEHNVSFPETDGKPSAFRALKSLMSEGLVYIQGADGREELYDIMNDPFESSDLTKDSRFVTVIERFREELKRICRLDTRRTR